MLNDLRYSARILRHNPGFAAFALAALAIGVGANTAVFSVVNQALLKPPPYRDPDRLVLFQSMNPRQQTLEGYTSYDDFQDLRRESHMLRFFSAVSPRWNFSLRRTQGAEQVSGQWVSAGLFPLLGVNPMLGRSFTEAEDRPGDIPAVILSYELWQRAFGGDPSILGRRVRIDTDAPAVVGIMPPGFRFLDDAELWVPLAPNSINQRGRGVRYLTLAARLAPGVTIRQARSEAAALMNDFENRYPNTNTGFSPRLEPLADFLTAGARPVLLLLAGSVALVLLIACVNVANLMLNRTLARRHEIAVRIALGAGRARLVCQLLSEGLLLASAGGALGLIVAAWSVYAIRAANRAWVPGLAGLHIDGAVLAFTASAALFSALIVSLLPALRISNSDWTNGLAAESRSATPGAHGQRLRAALVAGEVALTTVLLVGSGLLLRSLIRVLDVHPGFDAANLLTFQVNLPSDLYASPAARKQFYDRFSDAIRSLPGVFAAGAVSRLPLGVGNITSSFTVEGRPIPEGDLPSIDYRIASEEYFRAMAIPLLEGRLPDPDNPNEVIVNQTAALRFWPGRTAIGKRVRLGLGASSEPWKTVTGIVGDVHHLALDIVPRPEVYRPYIANPLGAPVFAVRAAGNKDTLAAAIRERLRALDPQVPMFNVSTMEQLLARSLESRRFSVLLLAIFAGVALLLAAIGLYGVVSYAVGLRTHEIAIRVALGAERPSVVQMILAQGLRLAAAGLAAGLAAALALAPLFAKLVYGISGRDPFALLAAASLLLIVALLACYFPARKAAGLDPMAALRS